MNSSKRQQMPTWLSKTLLAGLALIFVLMPFHAFISTWGGSTLGPLWLWKSWKELLLAALVIPVLIWLISSPVALKQLTRNVLVWLVVGYVLLTLLLAALFVDRNGLDATMAGLAMNLRYVLAGSLAYLLFLYGNPTKRWFTRAVWFVVGVGVLSAIIGIMQALILPADFLSRFGYSDATIAPAVFVDNNPELLRAFATLRGPNDFGAFLILPILLVLVAGKRLPWWALGTSFIVMVWALVLSSARSAWIGVIAAVTVLYVANSRWVLTVKQWAVIAGGVVILAAGLLYASISIPSLRMAVFHSSPGDSSLTEGSTDAHLSATLDGIVRVVSDPLGCGPGCAGPASYYGSEPRISENYVVQIAEEVGVVGLALFVLLVGVVARKLYLSRVHTELSRALLAALTAYICIGLLLHVWADDPLSIMWWTLAGSVVGYNERQRWMSSKNNSRSKTS